MSTKRINALPDGDATFTATARIPYEDSNDAANTTKYLTIAALTTDLASTFLPKSGGTMTGDIDLGGNIITNISDITNITSLNEVVIANYALTTGNLSQFAATTSSQLAGIISDETGSGSLVFAISPTIVTPTIASFTNAGHDHENAAGGGTIAAAAISDFASAVSSNAAVSANTAKVTNATHTGDVTGATALTLESVSITGQTLKATAVGADEVLISDSAASGVLKRTTVAQFLADAAGVTSINSDTTAAQVIAAGTGLDIVDATNTHTLSIDNTVTTLTGSQILTNKTLTTPSISDFASATHNHENATGGDKLTATNALDATGTTNSTTFLRGDDTWAVPTGTGANVTLDNLGTTAINADLNLGANKINFTNAAASIYTEDVDDELVFEGLGYLFNAQSTIHSITFRSPSTSPGPIHAFDFQASNSAAETETDYASMFIIVNNATAEAESSYIEINVVEGGSSKAIISLNENQEEELFIYNNIRFNNLSTGDDPILSSTNTARVLHLQGSYTISSKLYLTDETHSISKDSDDLAFEAPEFFNFVSANDSNHLKLFGQGNAINDVPALISFIGRNLADTANKTWGLIDVKILDTGTPGDSTMTFSLTNKQPLKLNPNERGEVFIDTNVEWENNANNDQLILTTDLNDNLTFESRVIKTYSTQQTEILATTKVTVDTDGESEISDLAITKPDYPSGKTQINYHLVFEPKVDDKNCDIVIKDNSVEVRRYSLSFPRRNVLGTIELSYISTTDGNDVTIFTDNASASDSGDIDFIGTNTAVNGEVCRVETLEIG